MEGYKQKISAELIEKWVRYWQLKVCVVFQEVMLDDQEAMFDDKEAMCVPMHFKVTATARFGCDNKKKTSHLL